MAHAFDPRIETKAELPALTFLLLNPRRSEEILKVRDPIVLNKNPNLLMGFYL